MSCLQAQKHEDTVALSLTFMNKVKKPLTKRQQAGDEKAAKELVEKVEEHREAVHGKLSAAQVRWRNLRELVSPKGAAGMVKAVAALGAQAKLAD